LTTPGSGIREAPFDYAREPELGSICLVRSALSSLQAAFPTCRRCRLLITRSLRGDRRQDATRLLWAGLRFHRVLGLDHQRSAKHMKDLLQRRQREFSTAGEDAAQLTSIYSSCLTELVARSEALFDQVCEVISRGAYDADENLRLALTHLIQIMGEAGSPVSREFSDRHAGDPVDRDHRHAPQGRPRLPRD